MIPAKIIKTLQEIKNKEFELINESKKIIKDQRGDLHNWKFFDVHHGWTFWYECKYCGKRIGENRQLTEKDKTEKCPFFDDDFTPYIHNLIKL